MISDNKRRVLRGLVFDLQHRYRMERPEYIQAKQALEDVIELLNEEESLYFLEEFLNGRNHNWDAYYTDICKLFDYISNIVILKRSNQPDAPRFSKDSLEQILMKDYIDLFFDYENRLQKNGWFKEDGKCNKRSLVALIVKLDHYGYFKPLKGKRNLMDQSFSSHIKTFFEARYNVNLTEEFKPSRREKINFNTDHLQLPKTEI